MSDKNIDKDINRCKELIKEEHSNWIGLTNQEAIENVLIILKTKEIENKDLKEKLYIQGNITEKWVKIAEKLAELILKEDINILNDICDKVPSKQCDNVEDGYCDKCIIDWARNEVESGK